jgi:hypothetical protein
VREPRRDVPNFRDHGLMVDRPLLRLVANLQRAHGYAWASEASLRAMVHQDSGHLPGVSTIPKALRRLERLGYVESRWIYRASLLPDGSTAEVGCLRLRVAVNRGERRGIAARAAKVDRRTNVSLRVQRTVPGDFKAALEAIGRAPGGVPPVSEQRERDYEASLARSRDWAQRLADAELEDLE